MQNDSKNVNTIQDLAVVIFHEFARIHETFSEVNNRLDNLEAGQKNLEAGQKILRMDLEKKIENEIENLALMTKHGFDEMSGNFQEVHEELGQVKNNVIGLDRRVTKLEESRLH